MGVTARTFAVVSAVCLPIIYGLVLEDTNVTLAVPDKVMTWDEAAQYCKENDGHLVTVTDDYTQMLLGTLMKIKGLSFLWIGAKEKESGWTWADDTGHGTFNAWAAGHPVNKDTEPTCTFLRGSQDYVWFDHPCAMQHAFICQLDIRSALCQQAGAFFYSDQHGGSCIVLHRSSPVSWYKAREACVRAGGRLAVFQNQTVYRQFKSHLAEQLQVSGDYWIGLRDSELQWQTGESVIATWWEGGQPSRSGRCVHVEKFGQDVYLWANQACSKHEAFVCQLSHGKVSGDTPPAKTNIIGQRWSCKQNKDPLHLTWSTFINSVIFQCIAFALGIILMLIPITILCRRKQRPARLAIKSDLPPRRNNDYRNVCPRTPQDVSSTQDPLPPRPTTENIYSLQPQVYSQDHGHHVQGEEEHPQYETPGSEPHGCINGAFLTRGQGQSTKAHVQALGLQVLPDSQISQFGSAHGQVQQQRQPVAIQEKEVQRQSNKESDDCATTPRQRDVPENKLAEEQMLSDTESPHTRTLYSIAEV